MTDKKPDMTTTAGKIADLRNRLAEAREPMGSEAARAAGEKGISTARQRIEALWIQTLSWKRMRLRVTAWRITAWIA